MNRLSSTQKRIFWAVLVMAIVIIVDQVLKFWVKTTFYLGEDRAIFSWWHLKFIENNGMAFGLELWNKMLLTFGRIIAVGVLIWIVSKVVRLQNVRIGCIIAIAMITAGAAGNIFDCVFYGEIFSNPYPPEVATLFPSGGGYAGWFEGRVVDMLYFPFFSWTWPQWVPIVGGTEFEFFQYIFNIADASICVGVAMLLLFFSKDVAIAYSYISGKEKENPNNL